MFCESSLTRVPPINSIGSAASFAKPTQSALLKKTQPKAPALPTFEAMMQTVEKQIKVVTGLRNNALFDTFP